MIMDRDHILAEIRRTAVDNNGEPLGVRRFRAETGIRDGEWERYWARWGDAVRDAGFTPNTKTKAYEDGSLIEKLLALARELGRFPAQSDLRLKAHREPGFPADTTFCRALGPRTEWPLKIAAYCREHGYDDVEALLPRAEARRATEDEERLSEPAFGFVYLMKMGKSYKIGRTNAFGRRERELAIQLPERCTKVHVIRTDDPEGIEAYWHRRFESKRLNGEWFQLAKADVDAFKRRKFM